MKVGEPQLCSEGWPLHRVTTPASLAQQLGGQAADQPGAGSVEAGEESTPHRLDYD